MSGYPKTLKYFIWQWQVHFMISAKSVAESLFGKIDKDLLPTAFLLGLRVEADENTFPICYEPEKMEFLNIDLGQVAFNARNIAQTDPTRDIRYSNGTQEEMDIRRDKRNFKLGLKKILDSHPAFNDKTHFLSKAVNRDNYDIYIVLQLKKSVYEKYQYLKYPDPKEILHTYQSFLDAAIDVYLEDRTLRLYAPEAGRSYISYRELEEYLRAAAVSFMYTISLAGRSGEVHELFHACHEASLAKYEGKENFGLLIVCRMGHPDLELDLELNSPFPLNDHRKLRKLLELTNDKTGVATNGEVVFGIGRILPSYDLTNEDLFSIRFRGLNCYDILHLDQQLLLMRFGIPIQKSYPIDPNKFKDDAMRLFNGITTHQIERLHELAIAAVESGKGTMLVFIEDAAEESKRLANQSIAIKPKQLTKEMIAVLSSIDGAMVIDLDGNIHAKGVILDGIAGPEGDSSRGSRYNSALIYEARRSWNNPTLIVVVSEDGMVDVIPRLMPQIRHSEIVQFIGTLKSLDSPQTFNTATYYYTMDLLKHRAFYLTASECGMINSLQKSLEKLDRQSGRIAWRAFSDFVPNPKMSERYYLNE